MINDQRSLSQLAPNFEVPPSLSTISTEWGEIKVQVVSNDGPAVRLSFTAGQTDTEADRFVDANFDVLLFEQDTQDINSFWAWLQNAIQSTIAEQRINYTMGLGIDLGVEVQNRLRDLIRDARKVLSSEMDINLREAYLEMFLVANLGFVQLRWLCDLDEILCLTCEFGASDLLTEGTEFDGSEYYLITKDVGMLRIIIHMVLAELGPQNLKAADFQQKFMFSLAQNGINVATPLHSYAGFKDSFEDVGIAEDVSES